MHADQFNRVFEEQVDRCRTTLGAKAKEYADDTDRLQNFKTAAAVRGVTPRKALAGMMVKHTVSLYDMLESDSEFPDALWDEKLGDHLNYLFLLRAILEEEKSERASVPQDGFAPTEFQRLV